MKSRKEVEYLRNLSYEELVKELRESKRQLLMLRMQVFAEPTRGSKISALRKKIARIKTLLSERKSSAQRGN